MKSKLMKGLVIVALAGSLTACEMDRQQRHTATGAAIGGVAGGLLGGDIATTLGGAALGGVIGSQVNKGGDYDDREYRHHKKNTKDITTTEDIVIGMTTGMINSKYR